MENIEYIPEKEAIEGFVGLLLLLSYTTLIVTVFGIVRCALLLGSDVTVNDSDVFDRLKRNDIEESYCNNEVVSHKVYHV